MKTFVRLIRRYVLAAVGIVLLLLFSGVAVLGWLGWQEGCRLPQREYSSSEIADSMVETAEGLAFGAERTPQEWMNGYEWAMGKMENAAPLPINHSPLSILHYPLNK